MKLIADSGSTTTLWRVIKNNGEVAMEVVTKGINPYFQTRLEIEEEIQFQLLPKFPYYFHIDSVFFYGSGCTPAKIPFIKNILEGCFIKHIEVSSDLLAAARAVCGHHKGIVAILGTGSNSCYYNGDIVEDNVSPLGFILGDEGSGAALGKALISLLFKQRQYASLKQTFLDEMNFSEHHIVEYVYKAPFPNRFLASLSPFILNHMDHPAIYQMVLDVFQSFIDLNLKQYAQIDEYPIHFVGSIAYHFRDYLEEALRASGVKMGTIVKDPMEGLTAFHSNQSL